MKHNLQDIKAVRYIGIALLVLILALVSSRSAAATPPPEDPIGNTQESQKAISGYLAAQNNPALSDEEKIKATIDAYFTLRYEGQKALVTQDFSPLLEDDTLNWVKTEQDKREIELYIGSLFDLAYQDYKFTLDYDSIEINADQAKVSLRQNHQVTYRVDTTHVSELAGLVHTITLQKKTGVWRIYEDEYEDEYTRLLDTTPKNEIMKQVYENYLIAQQYRVMPLEDHQPLPAYYSSYNRTTAKNFANQYAPVSTGAPIPDAVKNAYGGSWPSGWPQNYKVETVGGDCTNFVSQAVFEGTNYHSGDTNYFYPFPNDSNWYYKFSPDAGGSTTWIHTGTNQDGIPGFYDYLINTSAGKRGPFGVSIGSWNLCTGISVGDPIFMKSGENWQHAVIVDSFYTYGCYSPGSHIYVDSHTPNIRAVPLGTFSGYSWTGVHIQGYNAYTFTDVLPSHWAWQNIERLYASGITSGCATNPPQYCPQSNVTRAEMAVFLEKGIHGISYYFPPPWGIFSDVPINYWAAKWIEQLYIDGITAGCNANPLQYCPENSTSHAEMAIFLLRSKHGGSYTPPAVGSSTGFSDVPTSHWAAAWIKQAAAEGIFSSAELVSDGCAAGNFCPETPVTRALMAGWLVRTFNLP